MKAKVTDHVEDIKDTMFHNATSHIERLLSAMSDEVKGELTKEMATVSMGISTDYRSVLTVEAAAEALLRHRLLAVLDDADAMFAAVLGGPQVGRVTAGHVQDPADAANLLQRQRQRQASPKVKEDIESSTDMASLQETRTNTEEHVE